MLHLESFLLFDTYSVQLKMKNLNGINGILSMPSQILFCLEPQSKDLLYFFTNVDSTADPNKMFVYCWEL